LAPACSAFASVPIRAMPIPIQAPLCAIARWNSPLAAGDPTSAAVMLAPADSPNTVTLPGSPPNAPMFCCTQRNAASASSKP
jgi:hypothetical protein